MIPVLVHNNQPGIESHHGGQVVIAGQCRVDRIHGDAHAGLLVVELVDKNRDVIAAGGLDLLPPLGPPPPPVLVRLALNRVIRDLNVGLVGGLVLVQVSLAGDVKTMPGEEFVQLLASVALVISSLVARINHGQYR